MSDQIRLSFRNFRSIESADIALNGITVVTGINGCGKSTISKTLYRLFRLSNNFESIVLQRTSRKSTELSILNRILNFIIPRYVQKIQDNVTSIDSYKQYYMSLIEKAIEKVNSYEPDKAQKLIEKFEDYIPNIKESSDNLVEILEKLKRQAERLFETIEAEVHNRNIELLDKTLRNEFGQSIDCKNCLSVYEKDDLITDYQKKTLQPMLFVDSSVYIDTPMSIGLADDFLMSCPHWAELNRLLRLPPLEDNPNEELIEYIKKEIIHGSVSQDGITRNWQFTLEGTKQTFDLQQCATGIKAFSAILLLLQNGVLRDGTLLILDEPEAHLHPEWVVEYARLLVLLQEKVNLRLFIASHDSDFVCAIKNMADSKRLEQKVNFYLATPNNENPVRYNYDSLNSNTGNIHKEFNKAFDLTDKYCNTFEQETLQ